MRAVGYFRPDAAGTPGVPPSASPRAQFEQYCADRSQELIGVIGLDGPSPATPLADPEQFAQLTGLCDDARFRPDVVVIPDSTHLAPDLDHYVDRVLWLEAQGIEVRCASSPLLDALENGLKLLRPSPRSADRNFRIREAIAAKAQRGEVLGRAPYGYRVGLDGLLAPQPDEAAVVREIFDLYTAGSGVVGEQMGLRRISALLNRRGVRTRGGRLWSTVSLAGVLKNPAYTGYYKRRSVRIPGNHPAIVERAVFDRAQDAMSARRPRRRARTREQYLLAGLAICGLCGRTMHGLLRERRWKRKDGSESQRAYRYYECPTRPQGGGAHPSWRAEVIERAVFERIGLMAGAVLLPGGPAGEGIGEAVRQVRAAARRIGAGSGLIAEFTTARAQLRRMRAAARQEALVRMTVREALDAAMSADRDLARRAVVALVAGISVGIDAVEVQLRKVELE